MDVSDAHRRVLLLEKRTEKVERILLEFLRDGVVLLLVIIEN